MRATHNFVQVGAMFVNLDHVREITGSAITWSNGDVCEVLSQWAEDLNDLRRRLAKEEA